MPLWTTGLLLLEDGAGQWVQEHSRGKAVALSARSDMFARSAGGRTIAHLELFHDSLAERSKAVAQGAIP